MGSACRRAAQTPGGAVTRVPFARRELQAQEALQNGQLGGGDGTPDLQPGAVASQAMIEKILGEDPRWQGNPEALGGGPRRLPHTVDLTAFVYRPDGETESPVEYVSPAPQGVVAGGVPASRPQGCPGRSACGCCLGRGLCGGPLSRSRADVHRTPAPGTSLSPPVGLQEPSSVSLGLGDPRAWQAPQVVAVGGDILGVFIVNTQDVNVLFQLF